LQAISWSNLKAVKLGDEVSRKIFWGKNVMLAEVSLAPNAVVPVHDHVSEQVTVVKEGSIILSFGDDGDVSLSRGEMILIPSSKPHAALAGVDGCVVMDIFSPIRQDFIDSQSDQDASSWSGCQGRAELGDIFSNSSGKPDPYVQIQGYLAGAGTSIALEKLREVPLEILARYAYEKECMTMGQLRQALGIDKPTAKGLLRNWKHGDDHSESSYRRRLERLVVIPAEWDKIYKNS
jgi:quercetin dioxygenase-like cupin family protein